MKYRVKRETYINNKCGVLMTYYPQHKHWWCPWWHYFGWQDVYSDYVSFSTLDEALKHIEYEKSKHTFIDIIDVK